MNFVYNIKISIENKMYFYKFYVLIISIVYVQAWYTTIIESGTTIIKTLPRSTSTKTNSVISSTISTFTTTITNTISTSSLTTTTSSISVCTPSGGPCELDNPGVCCNEICFNNLPYPTCG